MIISEEQSVAKTHLAELESFLLSPVHVRYRLACEAEIKEWEQLILATDPVTREDEILILKSRGELNVLRSLPTRFENARDELKARVNELVERDNETSTT